MNLTYTWKLKSAKKGDIGDLSGVIVQTYWECTGTDEDGVSGTFHGATPFDPTGVDPEGFTPFEELTEAQVMGWIESIVTGVYKDHVDEQIKRQILEKKLTVVEVSEDALPWATPAE
jgi:hypothetical protein